MLKIACIDFAKKNSVKVLTNEAIARLCVEDRPSWEELVEALSHVQDEQD